MVNINDVMIWKLKTSLQASLSLLLSDLLFIATMKPWKETLIRPNRRNFPFTPVLPHSGLRNDDSLSKCLSYQKQLNCRFHGYEFIISYHPKPICKLSYVSVILAESVCGKSIKFFRSNTHITRRSFVCV